MDHQMAYCQFISTELKSLQFMSLLWATITTEVQFPTFTSALNEPNNCDTQNV